MNKVIRLLVAIGLISAATFAAESRSVAPLRLTLPPVCYAVPGVQMSIYYDNIVLTQTPENYRFTVKCDVGKSEARRWTLTPTDKVVGDHALTVTVADADGKALSQQKTTFRIVPTGAGTGKTIRLLIIGDSLTGATAYPTEIARLLSLPGNPTWKMLGTPRPSAAVKGVAHEGYGGWTWARFVSHYEPKPDPAQRKISSPFVFLGADGKPALDVPRYFKQTCAGELPDFVTIMLGINDCFRAPPDDPKGTDTCIDNMFKQAETLLVALRAAAPNANIGVCLTTPPNARESGFEANYKGKNRRWGWKRIQHRLVERQLEHIGNREKEHIFLVPTELNLDPVDGYPNNNGVHPNTAGYNQIGASIYAWLKWRLSIQN